MCMERKKTNVQYLKLIDHVQRKHHIISKLLGPLRHCNKINMQKSIAFLHKSNKHLEIEIENRILFTITIKTMRLLEINHSIPKEEFIPNALFSFLSTSNLPLFKIFPKYSHFCLLP